MLANSGLNRVGTHLKGSVTVLLVLVGHCKGASSKCRCWVVDAGVGLETEVLGHMGWRWVVHAGIGFEMLGLVVHVSFGSTCRYRFIDAGVGSCWVSVTRLVPVVSANMGYARRAMGVDIVGNDTDMVGSQVMVLS